MSNVDQWFKGFATNDHIARDVIITPKMYVDMCMEIEAKTHASALLGATLLARVIYWHGYSKENGERRMKINREGHYWLAKQNSDWLDECRINERTARHWIKVFVDDGLLIKRLWKFSNQPTVHLRLDYDRFQTRIAPFLPEALRLTPVNPTQEPDDDTQPPEWETLSEGQKVSALITVWGKHFDVTRLPKLYGAKTYRSQAQTMVERGITADILHKFLAAKTTPGSRWFDKRWIAKEIPFSFLPADVPKWMTIAKPTSSLVSNGNGASPANVDITEPEDMPE
jgi:hypothetical protein